MSTNICKENIIVSTTSYVDLCDYPTINNVELLGDVTLRQIDTYNRKYIDELVSSNRSVKYSENKPLPVDIVTGTIYYVGTSSPYDIYIYEDTDGGYKEHHVGTTDIPDNFQYKQDDNLETNSNTIVGSINELKDGKVNKNDTNLNTDSKNVVRAINELYDKMPPIQDANDDELYHDSKIITDSINDIYLSKGDMPKGVSDKDRLVLENGVLNHITEVKNDAIFGTKSSSATTVELPTVNVKNGHVVGNSLSKGIKVGDAVSTTTSGTTTSTSMYYHSIFLTATFLSSALFSFELFSTRSTAITSMSTFKSQLTKAGHVSRTTGIRSGSSLRNSGVFYVRNNTLYYADDEDNDTNFETLGFKTYDFVDSVIQIH